MLKLQIVLADLDKAYISMLELRFLEHFGDVADIQLISDRDYFQEYFSTHRKLDLLILSDAFYSPSLARHDIGAILRLSETPVAGEQGETAGEGGRLLYKYSAMKTIFAEIQPYLGRDRAAAARLLCVYAPAGGMGTTTVALGLAGALAGHQRKVLFVDTQPIQSSRMLLPRCPPPPPEFQTALLTGGPALAQQLPGVCGHGSFDFIPPFDHMVTTYGVGLEHYRGLLELVKRAGAYDFVVVDCSSEFTQEKSLLISQCDQVVVVTGQDPAASWKTATLLQDINIPDKDRFLFLCNRYRADSHDYLKERLSGKAMITDYLEELPQEVCNDLEKLTAVSEFAMLALRVL